MKRKRWLSVGGAGLLVTAASLATAENQHVTEALAHAQASVAQGKQGYPDALVTQAQEALKHAEQAKKETKSPHLDEGIALLRSAIDHGKQGHGEPATKAAEAAVTHLSQATVSPAESPQADTGY
jgi:protein involved in temperature-dependent protein secretion